MTALANDQNSAILEKEIQVQEFKELVEANTGITIVSDILNSLEHIEYFYSKDGQNYKVVENSNNTLTYVESDIFVQNSLGEYILETSTITEVQDNEIVITKTKNGETTKEIIKLELNSTSNVQKDTILSTSPAEVSASLSSTAVSNWTYHYTDNYSYRIYTYTLVSVTAVVLGIASFFTGTAPVVTGAIATIASYIVDDHIPRVWYTVDVFYKYIPMANDYRYKVAELANQYHYADSNRTDYLGSTRSEYWLHPEYK